MYWLDTEESWEWWAECWKVILEAAGVHAGDRIYFAFSFGPFIGFWAGWRVQKTRRHGGLRRRTVYCAAAEGDNRLRRDGAYLHANVRATWRRGEKQAWISPKNPPSGSPSMPASRGRAFRAQKR